MTARDRAQRPARAAPRPRSNRSRSWSANGRPPTGLRPWQWATIGAVALFVVITAFAAMRFVTVAHDLQKARSLLATAQSEVQAGNVHGGQVHLDEASILVARANRVLYGRTIGLVGWVPVVHQNLQALQRSVSVAFTLVNGGERILAAGQSLVGPTGQLQVPVHAGAVPLPALQAIDQEINRLLLTLPAEVDKPKSRLLIGPVAHVGDVVFRESGVRRAQLDSLGRGLSLLVDLVGGNGRRRYFVGVANTAEMRGSGGMILAYVILQSDNGTVRMVDNGGIDKLKLPAPVAAQLPADYHARWDQFGPTLNWRATNLGADFTLNGPTMTAMAASVTNSRFDGAFQVDPAGLAALLSGIGPIQVPGVGTANADNVVDLTLNKAYTLFPNRDLRQDVLADVATEAFRVLTNGNLTSVTALAQALSTAAQQRHILLWTADVDAEQDAHSFQADGALPNPAALDYGLLTVQNVAGNKLDYYLESAVNLQGQRTSRGPSKVNAIVTLTNTAPVGGKPPYVFGPFDATQVAGEYRGIVSLYLPTGTTLTAASGAASTTPGITTEGGRAVASFNVRIPAGASVQVALALELPPAGGGRYEFAAVPQPRIRPTRWTIDLALDSGAHATLDQPVSVPTLVRSGAAPSGVPVSLLVRGSPQ